MGDFPISRFSHTRSGDNSAAQPPDNGASTYKPCFSGPRAEPRPGCAGVQNIRCLLTGTDSPVSAASSIFMLALSKYGHPPEQHRPLRENYNITGYGALISFSLPFSTPRASPSTWLPRSPAELQLFSALLSCMRNTEHRI